MNVEIQRNHPSDAADTRALWEEIFTEDSAAFLDYYYSVKTKDNQLQTIRTDGVLTAMIHWNPYPIPDLRIGGRQLLPGRCRHEERIPPPGADGFPAEGGAARLCKSADSAGMADAGQTRRFNEPFEFPVYL